MTEKGRIDYVIKCNKEGAYERGETVPISILQKSLITHDELLLIEYIRKNPKHREIIINYLKKHERQF